MWKAREWPQGWQMPGPQAVQNLQMPHPRTDKLRAGKCPAVARGAGGGCLLGAVGIDWCISSRFEFRFESLKSISVLILSVYKLMIRSCKSYRENYLRKRFWTQEKETWVKFNAGLIGLRTTGPRALPACTYIHHFEKCVRQDAFQNCETVYYCYISATSVDASFAT